MEAERPDLLLVDNDPATLRLLTKWLESGGFQVRCAENGEDAIEAVRECCPGIVLTDWNMPRMDGLQLCRWLRQQSLPHYVYIVILTARAETQDVVLGLETGADDFLTKPVQRDELLARLRCGSRVLAMERRMSHQARLDSLTGLATQRTLYKQLERNWHSNCENIRRMTCVMIDLDFFKNINDTHGHSVGDEVIRRVTRILQEHARPDDLVARYGGEEFCIMLADVDESQAVNWAEQVRETVSQQEIPVSESSLRITASFGVSERTEDTTTAEELVDRADQALLVAKQSGRNTVVSFHSINESARLRAIAAGGPGGFFKGLHAHHVMRIIVASLNQEETVGGAADFFLRFRISSAPVIDGGGRLVGYLSEKDVINIMLRPDCWSSKIKGVMKTDMVCYEEDTPVLAIYEFLCRVSIRSVLIVKNGRPTGMLSRGSLLRWFYNSVAVPELGKVSSDAPRADQMSRERVAKTAGKLVAESRKIEEDMHCEPEELVPCLVGGASRMQELLNDLLAYSRYLNAVTNGDFASWRSDGADTSTEQAARESDVQQGRAGLLEAGQLLDEDLDAAAFTRPDNTPIA